MKTLSFFSLLAVSAVMTAGLSLASETPNAQPVIPKTAATTTPANSVIVAELFTSQSCSSCPPAEALFSTLADRDDLLTIEWHVDYWDDLFHGGSRWKDVYSSDAFTDRQRAYNRSLRGKSAVYTPQAIVNGRLEGVGSRRSEVSNMLDNATTLSVPVQIENDTAIIGPSKQSADILFVRLLEQHETNVKGGENKGRKLAGKNIVLEAQVLGQTGENSTEFTLPFVGEGETCAVLVQTVDYNVGPVLGAAKCG